MMNAMKARAALVGVAIALIGCTLVAGCSPRAPAAVAIEVSPARTLADEAVTVRISGLIAGTEVTVSAKAVDTAAQVWRSEATFVADARGVVDLGRDAPKSGGSYDGVDAMGLLSYMAPVLEGADEALFHPADDSFEVMVSASVAGAKVAQVSAWRVFQAEGIAHRAVDLIADGVEGDLFLPPAGAPRRPCVLLIGGSEGGVSLQLEGALLASRGYPALALAYFGLPGLASTLANIPLEYFATAARLLREQSSSNPSALVAIGYSRGSEAALLLAQNFRDLVGAIVVYAPSSRVVPGFPSGATAWTLQGRPMPAEAIPLDRVDGPILAIAGTADPVWPSSQSAHEIADRRDGSAPPAEALVYSGAGHGVGTFPYRPAGTSAEHPTLGAVDLGGTREANESARREGWARVLSLLERLAMASG
jgi:dienelactone hydrolase